VGKKERQKEGSGSRRGGRFRTFNGYRILGTTRYSGKRRDHREITVCGSLTSLNICVCVFVSVSYMSMPQDERGHAALFFETEPDHLLSVHRPSLVLVLASVSSCARRMRRDWGEGKPCTVQGEMEGRNKVSQQMSTASNPII
jgi:hypothetical protein